MPVENNDESTGGITGKGFQKGKSGNPGGRPKMSEELREAFKARGHDALNCLIEVMQSGEKGSERVAAAKEILDRGFGKAVQTIEGDITAEIGVHHIGKPDFLK